MTLKRAYKTFIKSLDKELIITINTYNYCLYVVSTSLKKTGGIVLFFKLKVYTAEYYKTTGASFQTHYI